MEISNTTSQLLNWDDKNTVTTIKQIRDTKTDFDPFNWELIVFMTNFSA